MDRNLEWHQSLRVDRLLKRLEQNNMEGFYVNTREELIDKIKKLIPDKSIVGVGDSVTLFETGIIDLLRAGNYDFLDKYQEDLTREEKDDLYAR